MNSEGKKTSQAGLGWQPSLPSRNHAGAHNCRSRDPASTPPAGDGHGGCSGMPDDTAAMLDRLRTAAAEHDEDLAFSEYEWPP